MAEKLVTIVRISHFVKIMEEYLICVQLFEEPSLEDLSETIRGDEIGLLTYAVKVAGATRAEIVEIVSRNRLASLSGREASYPGFNLHPFVSKVEIDEDFVRYYASQVSVFSVDAALDKPTNRECDMLRRCMLQGVHSHFMAWNKESVIHFGPFGNKLKTSFQGLSPCKGSASQPSRAKRRPGFQVGSRIREHVRS